MQKGNWIPLDKNLKNFFPKRRPFSEIEAAFSLSLDYDCDNSVTVAGYAKQWSWSRKRVNNFFKQIGLKIIYPQNTRQKQNQRGQIGLQIRDRSGTDKGQIRLIDSKDIKPVGDRSGTDKEQIRDRSGSTTIDPKSLILNPKSGETPPIQKCKPAFQQMRDVLNMSDQEITAIYGVCSEPGRLTEAVQCALEFDQDLRAKQGKAISDPAAYIRKAYINGKQSGKTRFHNKNNQPQKQAFVKNGERSLSEIAAAMKPDGLGIKLEYKD